MNQTILFSLGKLKAPLLSLSGVRKITEQKTNGGFDFKIKPAVFCILGVWIHASFSGIHQSCKYFISSFVI